MTFNNPCSGSPAASLLSPTGGDVWTEGVQVIEWQADDRDGDELDAAVQYSDDGGASWTTLGTHITGSSFAIDSGLLAGSEGDALIRVIVSDGFNSTAVRSSRFSVQDRPPSVRIAAPVTGATFLSNDPVVFTGSGLDPEDGSLASDSLVWTSDIDGRLGSGEQLTLDGLSVGHHVITLQAEDAAGHTVVDTIEMNVVAAPNTQPIADAGDDASVGVGEALDLDGSRSLDPDGDELAFAWTLVAAPSDQAEETVVLDGADMATPTFSAEVAGEYRIRLVVSDGEVESFAAYVTITVEVGCATNQERAAFVTRPWLWSTDCVFQLDRPSTSWSGSRRSKARRFAKNRKRALDLTLVQQQMSSASS